MESFHRNVILTTSSVIAIVCACGKDDNIRLSCLSLHIESFKHSRACIAVNTQIIYYIIISIFS